MNMFLLFIFCLVNNTLNIFLLCLYQHRYTVMRIKPNSSLTVIIRLIPVAGLIELFLIQVSIPQLVYQKPWYELSCLWDGAYKTSQAAIGKNVLDEGAGMHYNSLL